MANAYFEFRRVDSFDKDKNKKDCFTIDDMNGVDENYKFVLASECPNSIDDCLDEDGTLNDDVIIINTLGERDGLVPLLYSEGINGESSISVNSMSVVYELPDEITKIQAIFLTSYGNGSGYVMAYSINGAAVEVQDDTLILNMAGMIWGTHYAGE